MCSSAYPGTLEVIVLERLGGEFAGALPLLRAFQQGEGGVLRLVQTAQIRAGDDDVQITHDLTDGDGRIAMLDARSGLAADIRTHGRFGLQQTAGLAQAREVLAEVLEILGRDAGALPFSALFSCGLFPVQ